MFLQTVALAFVVLLLAVAGMAIGAIVSGRRLTGSCGGLSAVPGVDQCGVCGRELRDDGLQSNCGKLTPSPDRR